MYQVHNLTVPANSQVNLDATGEYVACISSTGDFYIGVDHTTPQFMQAGLMFQVKPGEPFEALSLRNKSAENVEISIAVGNGDFRDSRLSLSGAVTVSEIQTPVSVGNFPSINDRVTVIGAESKVLHHVVGGVYNCFLPGDNVNGAILKTVSMKGIGGSHSGLYADTVSPNDHTDDTRRCILKVNGGVLATLDRPVKIPPGNGLWLAAYDRQYFAATWDLLT